MKMKRIFAALTVLAMAFLCACGTNGQPTTEPRAEITTVRLTFPEGYTAQQIAQRLEENGVCGAKEFLTLVKNGFSAADGGQSLSDKVAAHIDNKQDKLYLLEGYLFPDTYDFYVPESPESVLGRFLQQTLSRLLTEQNIERAAELGYSIDEIITLASVIEKEACGFDEMYTVSSVLHNRLSSDAYRRLQCDVTVNYVNSVVEAGYIELDAQSAAELYNTYKCDGLPAGAISSVSEKALDAALNPESTDYYFFVTDSDMNFYYAADYQQHLENCKLCGIG